MDILVRDGLTSSTIDLYGNSRRSLFVCFCLSVCESVMRGSVWTMKSMDREAQMWGFFRVTWPKEP